MSIITTLWAWIVAHQAELLAAGGALWTGVSIVVRLTPSPVDDEYLGRAREWLERASFLQPVNLQRHENAGLFSLPGAKAKRPE